MPTTQTSPPSNTNATVPEPQNMANQFPPIPHENSLIISPQSLTNNTATTEHSQVISLNSPLPEYNEVNSPLKKKKRKLRVGSIVCDMEMEKDVLPKRPRERDINDAEVSMKKHKGIFLEEEDEAAESESQTRCEK